MVEEAAALGAHGVVGVADAMTPLPGTGAVEFSIKGTAVTVPGAPRPDRPFSTFLSGQRLAKLIEAGFVPVSAVAACSSVQMISYCITRYQLAGTAAGNWSGAMSGGVAGVHSIVQVGKAQRPPDISPVSRCEASSATTSSMGPRSRASKKKWRGRPHHPVPRPRHQGPPVQALRPPARGRTRGPPVVTEHPTELQKAVAALAQVAGQGGGTTSELSIDETLLLHSIGWEPVDLVFGVSWWSVPWGAWQWQTGEVLEASNAFAGALTEAAEQLRDECVGAGGSGVVGVEIELRVTSHHVDVTLTGTAIRRTGTASPGFEFISDLSGRDFALLTRWGGGRSVWWPAPASSWHRAGGPSSGRPSSARTSSSPT